MPELKLDIRTCWWLIIFITVTEAAAWSLVGCFLSLCDWVLGVPQFTASNAQGYESWDLSLPVSRSMGEYSSKEWNNFVSKNRRFERKIAEKNSKFVRTEVKLSNFPFSSYFLVENTYFLLKFLQNIPTCLEILASGDQLQGTLPSPDKMWYQIGLLSPEQASN